MNFFNKVTAALALVTMSIASVSTVNARETKLDLGDDVKETSGKVLRLFLEKKEDQKEGCPYKILDARYLEPGESDLEKVTQTPSNLTNQEMEKTTIEKSSTLIKEEYTEEQLLTIIAKHEAEEEAEAAAQAKKLKEEEEVRALEAEQVFKTIGTYGAQNALANQDVQNLLSSLGGNNFLTRLQDKNEKSLRHRVEEQANFEKYGYRVHNRKLDRLVKKGIVKK